MYNPIVSSVIASITIGIIIEFYYKFKYKDDEDMIDINDKTKKQITCMIGIFAITYIYLICSCKSDTTIVESDNTNALEEVEDFIDEYVPSKVPF
tara:strand:- start:1437 stop:1721 length:285 start_codon:yes stop_codon:yes gene_type:complete